MVGNWEQDGNRGFSYMSYRTIPPQVINGPPGPTLRELAESQDPEGKLKAIVDLLQESNNIFDDPYWVAPSLTKFERFYFWLLRRFS